MAASDQGATGQGPLATGARDGREDDEFHDTASSHAELDQLTKRAEGEAANKRQEKNQPVVEEAHTCNPDEPRRPRSRIDIEATVEETVAKLLNHQGLSSMDNGAEIEKRMGNRYPSNHESIVQTRSSGIDSDRVVIIKKEKIKITELKELSTSTIRVFLHEMSEAEKIGQEVSASTHIKEKALELVMCKCPVLSNKAIKSFLEKLYDRNMERLKEEPMALIRAKVRWSTEKDKPNEEKVRAFLNDLSVQMYYIKENASEGTLSRERIMQEVVKQLPVGLEIAPEDVISNRRYQTVDGLGELIENRLPLLKKKSNRVSREPLECEPQITGSFDSLLSRVRSLEQQQILFQPGEKTTTPGANQQ